MRAWLTLFLAIVLVPFIVAQTAQVANPDLVSMEQKLKRIQTNSELQQPDETPTEFSEREINTYFASGMIQLPEGVESVRFTGQPGVITGTAEVDFEKLEAGRSSYNPLLSIFSGVHEVVVVAHAHGAGGQGLLHVDTVTLDGVEIPRYVLQMFAEKYLQPKYPEIGLDSQFPLPYRIDTATVGTHVLAVTQK
jgi:hypothetical protein